MKRDAEPSSREAAPSAVTHRSLERGLAVLEAVAASGGRVTLADTARKLGLHRSTAHHLMQTLTTLGWLRQDEATRAYELSPRLYQLTGQRFSIAQVGEMAQPLLEELTRITGEGSSVAAWVDGAVTIAAKREHDGPVRVVQDVGAVRQIYCTAVGKAIAGWLPKAEWLAAIRREKMLPLTPKTITTEAEFETEMRRIHNAGYAIDDEEQFEGLRCIAMPVFGASGQVLGSMCVVGPKHRMTHQKLMAARAPLTAAARRLSEKLGWMPPATK
ncbi:MAG: IclR family transcriptional regulator [Burkholderiaceae bacterium]